MAARTEFKRAVLGLHLHTLDPDVIDVAAGLAERLGLNLVGLLSLDNSLPELAGYPGMREFLPAAREWRPIDPDRIAREQMLAAQNAQRLFTKLVETLRVPSTFAIVSGAAAQSFASMCASDIVVVAEPRRASASVTHSHSLFLDAAVRSPASVLLIPRSVQRRKGPIVAIATMPNDPAIEVASSIAAAAQEELILIEAFEPAALTGPATPVESAITPTLRIRGDGRSLSDMRHLSARLGSCNESLIVVTRTDLAAAAGNLGMLIAKARCVPVLVLEPSPCATET